MNPYRSLSLGNYDAWKLRSPDDEYPHDEYPQAPEFECEFCDDRGCPQCPPVTLDDLDEIDAEIFANEV